MSFRDSPLHHVVGADGTRIAWFPHFEAVSRAKDEAPSPPDAARRGPAVVLTNGLSTTDNFWKYVVGALAPKVAVAHWDYRGHGRSDGARSGDYAIRTHADDLARVTEAVRARDGSDAPPVHVAFSMGVTVLLELYRSRPDLVGAMVLVAGGADHPYAGSPIFRVPGVRAAIRRGMRAAAPIVPKLSPVARRVTASRALFPLARAVGAIGRDAPRAEVEHFFRAVGTMDLRAYWESLRSLMDAHASDVLPRVRVPVLVIAPQRDVMTLRKDLDVLRRAIPGAEWMLVPRTGHAMLLEAGEAVAARIRQFLRGLDTTSEGGGMKTR